MPRWLWSLPLLVSCATPLAQSPPMPVPEDPRQRAVTVHPQDLVQARANLEFADEADYATERWPLATIDSIALALATLRTVDSLTRAQLAPDQLFTEEWSTIGVLFGLRESELTRRLRDCVLRVQAAGIPASRIPCWPAIDSALTRIPESRIVEASDSTNRTGFLRILVPVPYNRLRVIEEVRAALRAETNDETRFHVFPEPSFNLHLVERVDRDTMPWRYVIERGYGDCPSGCIYRRYYVYRYDPFTRRAWKEREYGDPYPEPRARPLPADSGASAPK